VSETRRRLTAKAPNGAYLYMDMTQWDIILPDENARAVLAQRIKAAMEEVGLTVTLEATVTPEWVQL
jgi:predicted metal-dependent phosphotriesterase family hydrolase